MHGAEVRRPLTQAPGLWGKRHFGPLSSLLLVTNHFAANAFRVA